MSAAGRAIAVCDAAAEVAPARASDAAHEAQRRGKSVSLAGRGAEIAAARARAGGRSREVHLPSGA